MFGGLRDGGEFGKSWGGKGNEFDLNTPCEILKDLRMLIKKYI